MGSTWKARYVGRVLGLAATALTLSVLQPSPAMALSPGCTGFNFTTTFNPADNSTFFSDLETGELVTVTVTALSAAQFTFGIDATTRVFNFPAAGSATQSIAITSNGFQGVIISAGVANNDPVTVTFACGLAPAQESGSSSLLLEQARRQFSNLAAQTSVMQVSESVSGAIADAFAGGGTLQVGEGRIASSFAALEDAAAEVAANEARTVYAALGYDSATAREPAGSVPSPWHGWADVRYTGLDDDAVSTFDGDHANATAGIGYRFTPDLIGGIVLGYEDFRYDLGLRDTKLEGDGWQAGGYSGWRIRDRLRLDGMLTYGRLSYDAQADAVTAGFSAERITGMLRLTGRWNLATWFLDPSARVIYAREEQDGFVDTAGVTHDDYAFNLGAASFGGEIGRPIMLDGVTVTPTLGLFGDYYYGESSTAFIGTLPGLNDSWSGRLAAGLRWAFDNGISAGVGAESGGFGADTRYVRLKASAAMTF